jgi:hypothetical protein
MVRIADQVERRDPQFIAPEPRRNGDVGANAGGLTEGYG